MTRILIAAALAATWFLSNPLSAQEHYGRWEWHDFGTTHLPPHWSETHVVPEFNGLVGGSLRDRPILFDVMSGELFEFENTGLPWINDVSDTYATIGQTDWYDHATRELSPLPVPEEAVGIFVGPVTATGRVAAEAWHSTPLGGPDWISLAIYDAGQVTTVIDPPWTREVIPNSGIFVPYGELYPRAISPNGRYVAGTANDIQAGGVARAFVADLDTGQITFGEGTIYHAVSDAGLPTAAIAINAAGQAVGTHGAGVLFNPLAIDDAGRVLRLVPGPMVPDPDFEPDEGILAETYQLQIGLPIHVAGDFNASGGVEQGDLDVILSGWGTSAEGAERPAAWVHDLAAGSGIIDQAELDRVLSRWGASDGPVVGPAPPAGNDAAIPEPATYLLAAIAVLTGVNGIRRRRPRAAQAGPDAP